MPHYDVPQGPDPAEVEPQSSNSTIRGACEPLRKWFRGFRAPASGKSSEFSRKIYLQLLNKGTVQGVLPTIIQ